MKKQMKFWFVLAFVFFVIIVMATLGNAPASTAGDARAIYNSKCAKCHGGDGRGKTLRGRRTHARDLTDSQWQNDVTDERLFNSISNGRNKMPGFKKQLS